MRNFINLVESITMDVDLNQKIENSLVGLTSEMQSIVMDGLDLIYQKNGEEISGADFLRFLRGLHKEEMNEQEVVRTIVKLFSFCVKATRTGFRWEVSTMADGEPIDVDPAMEQMARMQIEFTSAVQTRMEELGVFSKDEIVSHLVSMGMPHFQAEMFFDHTLSTMVGKTVRRHGDRYQMVRDETPTAAQHMDTFRKWADKPSSFR